MKTDKANTGTAARSGAIVDEERATSPRGRHLSLRAFLDRHSLWMIIVLFLVSAGAFGYQVSGKASRFSVATGVAPAAGRNAGVAAGDVQPGKYADSGVREVRIDAGMSVTDVVAALSTVAIDLAPALASRYPDRGAPASGVCWEVPDVNMVIWLYSADGIITSIGYWSEPGFGSEVERRAQAMVLNMEKHSALIDPTMHPGEDKTTY